jgi:hypothetical protein
MAPLPPHSTARLYIDYETCGFNHTQLVRAGTGVTPAEAVTEAAVIWGECSPLLHLVTITGARWSDALSDVSNPVAWTGDASYGGGAGVAYETAKYYDFVGRSVAGRRVRLSFFGAVALEIGDNYRASVAENADVANVLAALGLAEGVFVAIDGFQPLWHQYADMGVNAYWRNKIR